MSNCSHRNTTDDLTRPARAKWAHVWALGRGMLLACLLCACGASSGAGTDTKTNWLSTCEEDADCNDGLSCLCGQCNVECERSSQCGDLDEDAACFPVSDCGGVAAVCDMPASEGTDEATDGASPEATDVESTEASTDGVATDEGSSVDGMTEAMGSDEVVTDVQTDVMQSEPTDAGGMMVDPSCRPIEEYDFLGDECDLVDFDCANAFYDDCGCGCDDEACRPENEYVSFGADCDGQLIDCAAGSQSFEDACGCGCEPVAEVSDCRPADEYVATGEMCDAVSYDCLEGERQFADACGCGCEPDVAMQCRPDDEYEALGDTCQVVRFACPIGTQYFSDDCGCGCEAAPVCDTTGKRYTLDDPIACQTALISCEEGEMGFVDDCGCGCAAPPAAECPAPEGTEIDASVVSTDLCAGLSGGSGALVVDTLDEYEALAMDCGGFNAALAPEFADGTRVYVIFVAERTAANLLQVVDTGDEIVVGIEVPPYCGGAFPPTLMMTLELNDDSTKPIAPDVCYTGDCGNPDLLPP